MLPYRNSPQANSRSTRRIKKQRLHPRGIWFEELTFELITTRFYRAFLPGHEIEELNVENFALEPNSEWSEFTDECISLWQWLAYPTVSIV